MQTGKATAVACSNIAFVKYWGNRDSVRRVPLNDSISMNLDHTTTTTTVEFDATLTEDSLAMGGKPVSELALRRVSAQLDRIRALAKIDAHARVESRNTFPTGAGLASSASAFAALSLAATHAAGLELTEKELTMLARQASGSASRSISSGFVEWITSSDPNDSYAVSIAPPEYWDLRDVIAVVSHEEKQVGSSEGHTAAVTSPFLPVRLNALQIRFHHIRHGILARDLALIGPAIEQEAIELHLIAMTSLPPIFYWSPDMVRVIQSALQWRADGLAVYFTLDAGPNVHLICEGKDADQVERLAREVPGVQQVISNAPGSAARIVNEHLF